MVKRTRKESSAGICRCSQHEIPDVGIPESSLSHWMSAWDRLPTVKTRLRLIVLGGRLIKIDRFFDADFPARAVDREQQVRHRCSDLFLFRMFLYRTPKILRIG